MTLKEGGVTAPVPRFHDPVLQRAADETAPLFAATVRTLDMISEDIKTAEEMLNGAGVRVRASANGICSGLTWERGEPDRWRICAYYTEGGKPVRRVFIEAPASVRMDLAGLLPDLLRAAAQLKQGVGAF